MAQRDDSLWYNGKPAPGTVRLIVQSLTVIVSIIAGTWILRSEISDLNEAMREQSGRLERKMDSLRWRLDRVEMRLDSLRTDMPEDRSPRQSD